MLFPDRKNEVDNPEWLFERFGGKTQLDIALKGQKKDLKTTKKQIDAAFIDGLKSGAITKDKILFSAGENRIYAQSTRDKDFIKTEPVKKYFNRIDEPLTEQSFRHYKNENTFLTITEDFSIFDSKVYNKLKEQTKLNHEEIYKGIADVRLTGIHEEDLPLFEIEELIGPPHILPYSVDAYNRNQGKPLLKPSFNITPIKVAEKNINTNSSNRVTEIKNPSDGIFSSIYGAFSYALSPNSKFTEKVYDDSLKPKDVEREAVKTKLTFDNDDYGKNKDKNVKNKGTLDRKTLLKVKIGGIEDVYLSEKSSKKKLDIYNNKIKQLHHDYDNYEGDFIRYKKK